MSERYQVAIVGSGPAGLSAAARAAEYDLLAREQDPAHQPTHILLEEFEAHAKTIHRYQKGKHVMAEPNFLDLRSPIRFRAGTREAVLKWWERGIDDNQINVRFNAEVESIRGERGDFELTLKDGSTIAADNVVLAIGTAGNPRKMNVPGEDPRFVQYQLDDPDAYQNETIVVVGAGDAAIENALGLSRQNQVYIVNRRDEFARAKEGNLNAVLAAINDPQLDFYCFYETTVKAVELPESEGSMGAIVLNTTEGEKHVACHRVIARLGSIPPRGFVEKCGVKFPDDKPAALPELSPQYESNVPGLYIIGALGGYPLIKQAMNQGYDVIEYIRGNDVKPVDYALLQLQFAGLPYMADPEEILDLYRQRVPMFRRMNALLFREFILQSRIIASVPDTEALNEARDNVLEVEDQRWRQLLERREKELAELEEAGEPISSADRAPPERPHGTRIVKEGDVLFRDGEYTNTFYTIAEGEVQLRAGKGGATYSLKAGQFFGEMSLVSGRPRSGTAMIGPETILIETPRRMMVKLINSNEEIRQGIDWIFIVRALQKHFARSVPVSELKEIARDAALHQYSVGEEVYHEGDRGDCLHLIRSGTVTLSRQHGDEEVVIDHLQSGAIFGQMALMGDPTRRETVKAAVKTETISLKSAEFLALIKKDPDRIAEIQSTTSNQLRLETLLESVPEGGGIVAFLMEEGLGEATNAMVIDEDLCVGCDNCEKACAETHGGVSRLDRKSGVSRGSVQVPISCRHCEQPHCMKDCPVDAIHRAPTGQVFIDDSCIGCGNCITNCPYDAVQMAPAIRKKTRFLPWFLFGRGAGPGEGFSEAERHDIKAKEGFKAVKCDGCKDVKGGPACVRACPTGAAVRIAPEQFPELVMKR